MTSKHNKPVLMYEHHMTRKEREREELKLFLWSFLCAAEIFGVCMLAPFFL